MKSFTSKFSLASVVALLAFANSTLAGPPLICHSLDIGAAKSLPWVSNGWKPTGAETYNVNNLVAETISILDSNPTVIVHMETLRRAVIYSQKDPQVAKRLFLAFVSRSEKGSGSPTAALTKFDAGYLAETFKQYEWIDKHGYDPAHNFDGYALIKQVLKQRPNDAQMNFAAALVALDGPIEDQKSYAQKAVAGATSDPLLARNLGTHFMSAKTETMSNMITRNSDKVALQ